MKVINKGVEGRVKSVQRDYRTAENIGVRYRPGQRDRRERETGVCASVYLLKYAKACPCLRSYGAAYIEPVIKSPIRFGLVGDKAYP